MGRGRRRRQRLVAARALAVPRPPAAPAVRLVHPGHQADEFATARRSQPLQWGPSDVEVETMASRVVLVVGTRKGCFVLESGPDRREWEVRGPFCDGWPIYHAVFEPGSGTIYAAAASEWHGSGVWRSPDFGE